MSVNLILLVLWVLIWTRGSSECWFGALWLSGEELEEAGATLEADNQLHLLVVLIITNVLKSTRMVTWNYSKHLWTAIKFSQSSKIPNYSKTLHKYPQLPPNPYKVPKLPYNFPKLLPIPLKCPQLSQIPYNFLKVLPIPLKWPQLSQIPSQPKEGAESLITSAGCTLQESLHSLQLFPSFTLSLTISPSNIGPICFHSFFLQIP